MSKRKRYFESRRDAQKVVFNLLDAKIDAMDPRACLDQYSPPRCPECGSGNVSDLDEENLCDCFDCGIWWNPATHNLDNRPMAEAKEGEDIGDEGIEDEGIDSIKDYALNTVERRRITCTYARTTPESVEDGDFSESGWEDEEGHIIELDDWDIEEGLTVADIAAKFLKNNGAMEPSSSDFHEGVWYSTGWNTIDYQTGEKEEKNYHLKNFTVAEEEEIFNKINAR